MYNNNSVPFLINFLNTVDDRQAAKDLLSPLRVKDLKEIGNHFSIYMGNKKKADIVTSLVEGVIGARLRTRAIRGY